MVVELVSDKFDNCLGPGVIGRLFKAEAAGVGYNGIYTATHFGRVMWASSILIGIMWLSLSDHDL